MKNSKLEKKVSVVSRIKREFKELIYVGLEHYLTDRVFGDCHHHKESGTSTKNIVMHY